MAEEFDTIVIVVCMVVELGPDESFGLTTVCVTGPLVSDVLLGFCNSGVDEVFKASSVVGAFTPVVVVLGITLWVSGKIFSDELASLEVDKTGDELFVGVTEVTAVLAFEAAMVDVVLVVVVVALL